MPIKKIADLPKHLTCKDPDHDWDRDAAPPPGVYVHTCPGCQQKTPFTVTAQGHRFKHVPEAAPTPAPEPCPRRRPLGGRWS